MLKADLREEYGEGRIARVLLLRLELRMCCSDAAAGSEFLSSTSGAAGPARIPGGARPCHGDQRWPYGVTAECIGHTVTAGGSNSPSTGHSMGIRASDADRMATALVLQDAVARGLLAPGE